MNYLSVELWHVIIGSSLRYIVVAGIAYLIFYVWKRKAWIRFKIQQHFPTLSSIKTEVIFSLSTIVLFALVIYTVLFSSVRKYTLVYGDIQEYSLLYFWISIPLVIAFHDTYFYWMHRLMHWRKIFPYVHHIHHRSHNPTPLAAFAFHPLEALIEIGVLPLMVFFVPLHPAVLMIFGLYMIIMNVIGHLGFEMLPAGFIQNKVLRLFNTSTHHNMHHHYGKGNYGLYFNIWDRVMKTNHARYESEFTNVTSRARKQH
jgi:sterol desaturase/sphingolipid hydroxylase (fatty acid hydroxylase superfamily)